ncbi:protein trichome birefringence-like 24 isoform X2 [Salvia miltiorrhiza]|uniref:protein trichome birefringence-like 24 isoform X2 n=1 Tax=Salvia miltiorrhiza TaxID=226208 RepID=UPI0025ABC5BD|nr:protein trichome birefringence-like 24 isoform X2 [Salvia miltiorrhiza]
MVKKLKHQWWRSPQNNNYSFLIKLGVSVLLVALAFVLIYNKSSDSFALSASPFLQNTISQQNTHHIPTKDSEEKCNLFTGEWVAYKAEPVYTNRSCSFIEEHQNCMKNGRPDTNYLYWRWSPRGCELPRLDPGRFLQLMRNKSWAFIGDSISRNHVQSFLCLLSEVEEAIEVYHDKNYKSRRWLFPLHNLTVSVIWSPFLVQAAVFEDSNSFSTSDDVELHLDTLDKIWTQPYKSLDYMILSGGKWFLRNAIYYENNTVLGCHSCSKRNFTELGFDFAYRRMMRTVLNYIIASNHKGMLFYRTSTPDHFEGGEWYEGGTCKREAPVQEGKVELTELDKILHDIEVEEFEKLSGKVSESGVNLRLFDVNPRSLLRPDGHPGPYRFYQPFAKDKEAKIISDCLHWCLPGPIDSWNHVLMEMVVS